MDNDSLPGPAASCFLKNLIPHITFIPDEGLVPTCIGSLEDISGRPTVAVDQVFYPTFQPTPLRVNQYLIGFFNCLACTQLPWKSILNPSVKPVTNMISEAFSISSYLPIDR